MFVSLAALNTIDAPEYGLDKQQYEAGFVLGDVSCEL